MTVPDRSPEDKEYMDALDRLEAGGHDAFERRDLAATVRDALQRLRADSAAWERAAKAYASDVERLRGELRLCKEQEVPCELVLLRESAEAEVRRLNADLENEAVAYERASERVRRLTEGLREIERMAGAAGYGETPAKPIAEKARALLSANPPKGDAAAGSSPSDGAPGANVLTREFDAADFTGAEEYALEVIGAHRAALVAFANMMARELAANAHKDSHPLSGDFDHLLSELRGHVEKFASDPTEEHAADVANLAMLALAASPSDGGHAERMARIDEARAELRRIADGGGAK